ncbi:MAG: 6-carboxytetrahydropterin synthase [Thermoproteus sp.]
MRLCVVAKGSIAVAHKPSFSPIMGSLHGHDYTIRVAVCGPDDVDYVVDADELQQRLNALLAEMNGKYLKSSREESAPEPYYEVPCGPHGVTGECLARHIARSLGATWVEVCEGGLTSPCFYYGP